MAYTQTLTSLAPKRPAGASKTLGLILQRGLDWFVGLGEKTERARRLNALADISDEQLAAKGTNRLTEARRILGLHGMI